MPTSLGVNAQVNYVDFQNIMTRMHTLSTTTGQQAKAVEATPNLKWFKDVGEFVGDYTMKVGNETITAKYFSSFQARGPKSQELKV